MRWPGGNETRVGTVSGLAALEWSGKSRLAYAMVVGLSRQLAEEISNGPNGRHVDYRDPTWSMTLGGDAIVRLYRGVSVVPYLRWDTDGGRLAYGSQLRPGIGIRATF